MITATIKIRHCATKFVVQYPSTQQLFQILGEESPTTFTAILCHKHKDWEIVPINKADIIKVSIKHNNPSDEF